MIVGTVLHRDAVHWGLRKDNKEVPVTSCWWALKCFWHDDLVVTNDCITLSLSTSCLVVAKSLDSSFVAYCVISQLDLVSLRLAHCFLPVEDARPNRKSGHPFLVPMWYLWVYLFIAAGGVSWGYSAMLPWSPMYLTEPKWLVSELCTSHVLVVDSCSPVPAAVPCLRLAYLYPVGVSSLANPSSCHTVWQPPQS